MSPQPSTRKRSQLPPRPQALTLSPTPPQVPTFLTRQGRRETGGAGSSAICQMVWNGLDTLEPVCQDASSVTGARLILS
jgi:hypothetical protein